MTFLIGDGVMPGNEGRGYVLRKIMRRAMRHGKKLGLEEAFLHDLVSVVVDRMAGAYPSCARRRPPSRASCAPKKERFGSTLKQAMVEFGKTVEKLRRAGKGSVIPAPTLSASTTLRPAIDFLEELAQDYELTVDHEGLRARARGPARPGAPVLQDGRGHGRPALHGPLEKGATRFLGYDSLVHEEARVLAVLRDGQLASHLDQGQEGQIVLDQTPF
jgi:alanyl-tRNA synthetase